MKKNIKKKISSIFGNDKLEKEEKEKKEESNNNPQEIPLFNYPQINTINNYPQINTLTNTGDIIGSSNLGYYTKSSLYFPNNTYYGIAGYNNDSSIYQRNNYDELYNKYFNFENYEKLSDIKKSIVDKILSFILDYDKNEPFERNIEKVMGISISTLISYKIIKDI